MYNPCRSVAWPGSWWCLWIMCGYYRVLYERLCCNPFITVAAILWGVLPALAKPLFANRKKTGKTVGICVSIVVTAVLSSLVLTTAGLVIMLGYNFYAIMPGRLVQFAIMIPIYCVLTCLLYFSPLTAMVVGNTSPAVLKNKTV